MRKRIPSAHLKLRTPAVTLTNTCNQFFPDNIPATLFNNCFSYIQYTNPFTMKSILFLSLLVSLCACNGNRNNLEARVRQLQQKVDQYEAERRLTELRLTRFDSLDYQFYSGQQWDSLIISHHPGIKVFYPDGSITEGLAPQHIDRLTPQFVFAPDTKIKTHPVKFGTGEWTCVIGVMEGTFSRPMPAADGRTISPTGRRFSLQMATIGRWKDGKMTEEYLFWDNLAFMQQIGLAK
jgi:hypothetical protein